MSRMDEASGNPVGPAKPVVESLGLHPIKSARGLEPVRWWFDSRGPVLDRHWMLIDRDRRFLSLREVPALARLRIDLRGFDPIDARIEPTSLGLDFDGARFDLSPADRAPSTARLWGADRLVVDEGDAVADWLSRRLDRVVRLVRHDPASDPWVQPDPPARRAATGLSDGYPVLVLCRSTLEATLGRAWSHRRFRANVLVGDADVGAEDRWRRIRIGGVELELVKPCVRCVATTVEPERGVRDGVEPLHLLTERRTWNGKPTLGWNALVVRAGPIAVGDRIEVLETCDSAIESTIDG